MKLGKHQTVVLGPPGTGKTTTLLKMVEDALLAGIKPEEIAFLSFTKKAVTEAADRACERFKLNRKRFPLFQTVHSLCFSRLGCSKKDLMTKQNYLELGSWLGYDFTSSCDMEDGLLTSGVANGDKFLFLDSIARVKCQTIRETWEDEGFDVSWPELERFSKGYARYKERTGMMDFTDLLSKFVEEGAPTKAKIAFVDEAQDLSQAQWRVLQKCFADVDKVVIAGDDDQSIFKWSGADLNTFLTLQGEKKILNHSHRLPKAIHHKAQHTIKRIKNRYDKPFEPTDVEGSVDYVSSIEQARVVQDETTMVLVRNVYLLGPVYDHFKKLGLAYNGRNGFTSIGEGHVGAIRAWEAMRKGNSIPLADARLIYEHLRIGPVLARGGKVALDKHEETEEGITWETLRDHFGLLSKPLWHEALTGIPLEKREYYISLLRNKVKITAEPNVFINTIHGVKGGEADHVIIVSDMSKRTYMEMQKDPDSEARVAYVALTRAKKRVTIVMPNGRFSYPY